MARLTCRRALSTAPALLGLTAFALSCSLLHDPLPNESPEVDSSTASVVGDTLAEPVRLGDPTAPPGLDGIDTLRVRRGAQVLLSISGTDEDDDLLSYTWNAFHLGPELESGQFTPNANSPQVRWTAPQSIPGRSALYRIVVNISDNQEVTTQDPRRELIVEVLQRAPSLILSPADQQVAARDTLMLAALAEDDDGDRLTYIWALAGEDSTVFETEGRASAQRLALIDAADDTLAWWWTGRNDNLDADGPAAKIEQSRQSTTADTARVVMLGLTPGGYTIDLSVTDALADSAADTVRAAFRVTVAEPAADDTTGP